MQKKTVFPIDKAGHHAPGIYFGMPNEEYHDDPALGSSGIKIARQSVAEWWYQSPYNPRRPKKVETDPLVLGAAYHTMVLEGPEAFARGYIRRPDDDEEASPADKSKVTKASNEAAAKAGKESLHGDDYDRVLTAADMIHLHPELDGAFTNGVPEVSLFFELFGIRQKVRLDYLKIKGFGDLKTAANERRRPFAVVCGNAIHDYRIDMSMAHYLRGRSLMPAMIADGLVYGDHDSAWLKKVAAHKTFAAQLVFIQKTGAPLVWSKVITPHPDNPLYTIPLQHVDEGLLNYKNAVDKFGLAGTMWLDPADVQELNADDMPARYHFDHIAKK